jgi:signal transduction histidine kinase
MGSATACSPRHVRKLGLRLRIAVALAAVCLVVVAGLGITLYQASEAMEDALVDQIVGEELDFLIERGASAPPASRNGPNLQYFVVRSARDYEGIEPKFRNLDPGSYSVMIPSGERRVGVRDVGDVRYIVAYDPGPHETREHRFKLLLLSAMGAGAVVAVAMGYWIAGLLTRQLTELSARVPLLQLDAPHTPLERPDQGPEIAALARALDRYHEHIAEMMRREQEFTADASHELRTPLTAIRTSCELLATEARMSDKGRARLEMIAVAAEQMTERIDALLYLAREHPPTALEDVPLRDCVHQAATTCRDEMLHKGLEFEVRIDPQARVRLDRKALQIVLCNLVRNAVRYTERGYVRVSYDDQRLTVADSGRGISPQQLPQLFERYYRGGGDADGLGLGLAIVRRICDELGWKIEVKSEPGVGSAFSIVLPY